MHFYVTAPAFSTDIYFCVEEVGTGVVIELPGVDDLNWLMVDATQVACEPQTMLPHIVHQVLHYLLMMSCLVSSF